MNGLTEKLNEWQYALSKIVEGQLEAGSIAALLVVFAAGVLTSFTPCVYPMIPVTVTYIGGASAGKRSRAVSLSAVYVLGLALIYAALGIVTALLGKTFGSVTRTWWIYGGVTLLIVLFGLAMLDVFSIPVPGFAGRVQSKGTQKGGFVGALLMGVAAGFVAAPCTAPVLGILLIYVAQTGASGNVGDVMWGGTLLLVFALGLGLLLMLLGIFSGLLSSLPKAGVWMNRIKVVFGVGMLIIGAYFLWVTVDLFIHRGT
jgi:thiol:disulfide interchange protein DsbD